MDDRALWEFLMQRFGGWCAIAGAVLLVAAGIAFGSISFGHNAALALDNLSQYSAWYWAAVHTAVVAGAFMWVVAFMGVITTFRNMPSRVLGHTAEVCLMLGVALYAVGSFVSGSALSSLAARWAVASPIERPDILQSADTLLSILRGTWTGAVVLVHGVPFVLMGMAVAREAFYPRVLRWLGTVGGVGSMMSGALMLALPAVTPPALFLFFGAVTALWMVGIGLVMKRPAERARKVQQERLQVA